MRWIPLLLLGCLVGVGSALRAGPAAGYAEIAWEAPAGTTQEYEARFDCASDAGSHALIARFTTPATYVVDEIEAVVDYCSGDQPLPDWWTFDAAHRESALTVTAAFLPGPHTVSDYWQGRATASLTWEKTDFDMARIVVHVTMPAGSGAHVDPGTEYMAFRLDISHAGTSTQGGCGTGVCLVLNDLRFLGPGVDFRQHFEELYSKGTTRWQDGVPLCPFIVPVEPTTWSGLKALYR